MKKPDKYKVLIWAIAILLATNISMGFSFIYHKRQDRKMEEQANKSTVGEQEQRRTRFFKEQLNLRPGQMETFRQLNRDYNRNAGQINHDLETLRIQMVEEMGKENPSQAKLDSIASSIGKIHSKLKKETIGYYLSMKKECDKQQSGKLNEIFLSVLKQKEGRKSPGHHRNRYGANRK